LDETRDFFVELLGFQVNFDEDWYVHLSAPGDPALEVAVWRRDHELVPEAYRQRPAGMILTLVVDDVDAVHERAGKIGVTVVASPRDQFYGQRSCLVLDPNGLLVDISTPL
jgi:catechol 2,3-dioxygenase-like lactoylglutathione lyase family enzyme